MKPGQAYLKVRLQKKEKLNSVLIYLVIKLKLKQ